MNESEELFMKIDYIQDFFENIKKQKFVYSEKKESAYSSRRIELGSSRLIGNTQRGLATDKIRNMLNKK